MFENMKEIPKLISSVDLENLSVWIALRFHTGSLVKVHMIKKHVSQGQGWFFEKEINVSETVWAIKMDLTGTTVVRTYLPWYLLEAETIFIYFRVKYLKQHYFLMLRFIWLITWKTKRIGWVLLETPIPQVIPLKTCFHMARGRTRIQRNG